MTQAKNTDASSVKYGEREIEAGKLKVGKLELQQKEVKNLYLLEFSVRLNLQV